MGHDHSTHRALIYGPSEHGGFGVRHLYTEMLGMKLETIISHLLAQSDLGKIFTININYLQLLSGCGNPVLTTSNPLCYIKHNWLTHLRDYLIEINARIEVRNLWQPLPHRDKD
jgi:hypothetical protein